MLFIFRHNTRIVLYGNFYIEASFDYEDYILDTTDIYFLLAVSRIPEPKLNNLLTLNETTKYHFYDLTKLEDNSYVQILNTLSQTPIIEYFFVTDSNYGIFDFYRGIFEEYIAP